MAQVKEGKLEDKDLKAHKEKVVLRDHLVLRVL